MPNNKKLNAVGKAGPRASAAGKMILLGLGLVIPGLLISIIGIGSTARQKLARSLQLREQWQGQSERIAAGLEKSIARSAQAVFASLAVDPLDPSSPLQIQQRLKNLLAANPIVAYPFLITADGEYLFPFNRPLLTQPDPLDFSILRSGLETRQFLEGESLEFEERDWLAAIKKYISGATQATGLQEKEIFSMAIGRCYFKWGKYPQAIQYLLDVVAGQAVTDADERYLSARQLLALAYDRMGDREAASGCNLELYEEILALQAVRKLPQLDFYKNEALDYLNLQITRSAPLQERLTKALRRERLEGIPPREMSLRWQFFRIPELDQEGSAANRQGIEFKRLQQIQEFYLGNNEKKIFYARLRKEFPRLAAAPVSGKEPPSAAGFYRQAALQMAYAPLPLAEKSTGRVFFGFHIALAQIRQVLFPALLKKYWPHDKPMVVLATRAEAAALAADGLPQMALEKLLPGYVLAVKEPRPGYLEARIKKELLVNYALITSLLLTLLATVALFFRSQRRDRELLELKNRFLEGAAHTLKTPLARIRMLAEQLQLNWLKNEKQRTSHSGKIIAEADRMNDMIHNLLDLSRIEAGQKTYRLQPASLVEIANRVWQESLPLLKENGFACRAEIASAVPSFPFDASALRLVIGNLIQNAINYSPKQKEIVMKVYGSAGEAVLEVADKGQGIAPELHEAIFGKFFQVASEVNTKSQASGLGLFLVKHAVDAHGGRIEVQSAIGQGSRFIIRLPIPGGGIHSKKKGKRA